MSIHCTRKWVACICILLAVQRFFACAAPGVSVNPQQPSAETVAIPTENLATPAPTPTATPEPSPTPYEPQTIVVRFVGDLMVSKPMIDSAKQEDGTYDFEEIFDPIRDELQGADVLIGNLETPIAGEENEGFTGRPRFNAPDAYLTAIKNAGFTVLPNDNNHLLDRGVEGARTTIQKIRDAGFLHTGTYLTPEEAEELLIIDVDGVRLALLVYSYHSTRKEKPQDKETMEWMANFNEPEKMAADIKKAREQGAHVVLVFTHMGKEGTHEPTRLQRQMAQHLVDSGADAAIFCHSHAVQPFERLTDASGREVFVAYALGNFLADGAYNMSRSGMILQLPITVDQPAGTVKIQNISYLPTYSHQEARDGKTYFSLFPAGQAMNDEGLSERTRKLAGMAWETVTEVVGEDFAAAVDTFQ